MFSGISTFRILVFLLSCVKQTGFILNKKHHTKYYRTKLRSNLTCHNSYVYIKCAPKPWAPLLSIPYLQACVPSLLILLYVDSLAKLLVVKKFLHILWHAWTWNTTLSCTSSDVGVCVYFCRPWIRMTLMSIKVRIKILICGNLIL